MEKKRKLKLNARRIIVLAVLAIICILIIVGIVSLCKKLFSSEIVAGNLSNNGYAYVSGNEVFYNKYDKGIVKIKKGEEFQISDDGAYDITVIGDTIYYLAVSSSNTIDVRSVKTNGDSPKTIKTIYTIISKFYIKDNYLYYANSKDVSGIMKLSLETGEEKNVVTSNIQDFVLQNETIYFVDAQNKLHSISINATDYKDIETEHSMKKIQILKNWIYFFNENEKSLWKIKTNGKGEKQVATFINNETYNVTSKYIYYFDSTNKKICRCDLKGKKSHEIVTLEASATKINIAKGIIYYLEKSSDPTQIFQMNRVKVNGGAAKPIEY